MKVSASLFIFILAMFLASCGIDWNRQVTAVADTALRANPKVSLADNNLGPVARMTGLRLTGKTAAEGASRFVQVNHLGKKGWVLESLCVKQSEPGIIAGREKVAYKERPDGTPAGFLEPATLVLVKRNGKVEKPLHLMAIEGGRWKDMWVDGENVSVKPEDIEIYTVVLPTVAAYKGKGGSDSDPKKQYELALAYLNDIEAKYQKSEFYPETLAKAKAELRDLLGAAGSATEKSLETDTNNTYEIKR